MEIKWHKNTKEHMQIREKNGVTYLTYPSLEKMEDVIHGFSTRLGGVSKGIYSSMNLSFSRGDDEEAVWENFRRMSSALGVSPENLVMSDQTHTTNVRVVTQKDKGCGFSRKKDYTDVDGLITNVPGLVLTTFYADCVPLFFVDPVHHAIGLSHSGWRGTAGRIGQVTVERMKEAFGTEPGDVYAAIGPSICQDCYEVSEDVIEIFADQFDPSYHAGLFYKKQNGKYQLNLWEANRIVFVEAGIREDRISQPGICTCCNPQFLFSHRASRGKRGNLAAFLALKERA